MDNAQQYLASASLCIVVIGILGNLLSLALFLRHSSSVNVLLSALSICDAGLLLCSIPVFILPNLAIWKSQANLLNFLSYTLKFAYPLNLMLQTASIYVMVLITMERWTAVCRPLQVRIWCTARSSRLALLVVVFWAIIYNCPRFFEYSIMETPTGMIYERNLRDINRHPFYVIFYYTVLYLISHFLLPFGLILFANLHVIKSIIAIKRARRALTRQQQREQRTSVMLVTITLLFAFTNALPFILNLAECVKRDLFEAESTAWIAFYLNDFSTLLVVLNSSTTWIVYIIFSAKYRQGAARLLLRCWIPSSEKDIVKYNSLSRTHSMRASTTLNRRPPATSYTNDSIKPLQKRTDRSLSEAFVDRARKPNSTILPAKRAPSVKSSIKTKIYRIASGRPKRQNSPLTNGTLQTTEFLSPPPVQHPPLQWKTPDRPNLVE
ncbi:FMRFamide receptor [Aphelenchoides besseyi]|nr:FMRFamide receptor [Aphelenchoides besseyi]KAI6237328.1 FMRFamide receptor [Aphelenchoides besseyi]